MRCRHDCTGRLTDRLGYERYWMAEIAMPTWHARRRSAACASRRRDAANSHGSGGVMCRLQSAQVPSSFAFCTRFIRTHRLGNWSCSGGSPLILLRCVATRRSTLPDDFPEQPDRVIAFLHNDFPEKHPFARILVSPAIRTLPDVCYWFQHVEVRTPLRNRTAVRLRAFHLPEPTRVRSNTMRPRFSRSDICPRRKQSSRWVRSARKLTKQRYGLMASGAFNASTPRPGEWLPIPTSRKPSRTRRCRAAAVT